VSKWLVVAAAVGWIGAALPASAHVDRLTLVVRIYNVSGVPSGEVIAARGAVHTILRDAEIDIVWRDCTSADPFGATASSCGERVDADELVVRIVPSGRQAFADSLGYSIVDAQVPGCLVTIFGDHIAQMAARAGVDAGPLLGRAIAHEIGHLLLGTAHSPAGLMRAHWYDDELRRNLQSDWTLSGREALRMRLALLDRSRSRGVAAVATGRGAR
jgi:hypothetical protein